jgi:murein DD-endopeptidase MepM/ murein hydrolase activator NlpD
MTDSEVQKPESFLDKLRHKFRVVLMTDDTFQEIASYQLTQLNIYIAVSTVLVAVVALVVGLIVYTPLKQYIPGYGDYDLRKQVLELSMRSDSLEEALDDHRVYIESLQKMFTGGLSNSKPYLSAEQEAESGAQEKVTPIKEDSILREKLSEDVTPVAQKQRSGTGKEDLQSRMVAFFAPPIHGGFITDKYDPLNRHYGVDVAAPKDTPIKAIGDGVVLCATWTVETGNIIGIQHKNNFVSFYKHNSQLLKKVGSFVKTGEAIAIIGNTGELSDGPHLHFELWSGGQPINPVEYMKF